MSVEEEQHDVFSDVPDLRQRAFFRAYCQIHGFGIKKAQRIAGVGRNQHWEWLANDPEYPARFERVRRVASYKMIREMDRRAFEGNRRPVLYKGAQVEIKNPKTGQMEPLWEVVFSDNLAMFLAKGALPETFRERTEQQIKGEMTIDVPAPPTWLLARGRQDSQTK